MENIIGLQSLETLVDRLAFVGSGLDIEHLDAALKEICCNEGVGIESVLGMYGKHYELTYSPESRITAVQIVSKSEGFEVNFKRQGEITTVFGVIPVEYGVNEGREALRRMVVQFAK